MPARLSQAAKQKGKGRKKAQPSVTGQTKAGLIFAPSRCNRYLKQGRYADRYGSGAGVFMAGVLEYLTCEMLELAGNCAEEHKKKTIAPRHIQLAIFNDEELNKLMAAIQIYEGGYQANVNAFLFPAKKGKKVEGTQEM
jgi:histone H2A